MICAMDAHKRRVQSAGRNEFSNDEKSRKAKQLFPQDYVKPRAKHWTGTALFLIRIVAGGDGSNHAPRNNKQQVKYMKTIIQKVSALLLVAAAMVSASPTPTPAGKSPPRRPPARKVDESDKPPFIGMTKAQALARYGNPKQKTSTEEGEQWTYILNLGEFVGKHMIPFFFSTQGLRTGVLIFGQDGHVKKFRWDTPEA
jgi:hypothetical protein